MGVTRKKLIEQSINYMKTQRLDGQQGIQLHLRS